MCADPCQQRFLTNLLRSQSFLICSINPGTVQPKISRRNARANLCHGRCRGDFSSLGWDWLGFASAGVLLQESKESTDMDPSVKRSNHKIVLAPKNSDSQRDWHVSNSIDLITFDWVSSPLHCSCPDSVMIIQVLYCCCFTPNISNPTVWRKNP